MAIKYVSRVTVPLKDDYGNHIAALLWGDPVHVLGTSGKSVHVRARRREGWVEAAALSDRSLLETYVIDVGWGDGVLLKTPEGKSHLIDAGVANREQKTRKSAANFTRWKFIEDLCETKLSRANVVVTRPDDAHYGGLLDFFSGRLSCWRPFKVEVENFYHFGEARKCILDDSEAAYFRAGGRFVAIYANPACSTEWDARKSKCVKDLFRVMVDLKQGQDLSPGLAGDCRLVRVEKGP